MRKGSHDDDDYDNFDDNFFEVDECDDNHNDKANQTNILNPNLNLVHHL